MLANFDYTIIEIETMSFFETLNTENQILAPPRQEYHRKGIAFNDSSKLLKLVNLNQDTRIT